MRSGRPIAVGAAADRHQQDEASLFALLRPPLMPVKLPGSRDVRHHPRRGSDGGGATRESLSAAYAGTNAKVAGLGIARDIAFRMPTIWLAEAQPPRTRVPVPIRWATKVMKALRMGATRHRTPVRVGQSDPCAARSAPRSASTAARPVRTSRHRMRRRWTAFAHLATPSGVEPIGRPSTNTYARRWSSTPPTASSTTWTRNPAGMGDETLHYR